MKSCLILTFLLSSGILLAQHVKVEDRPMSKGTFTSFGVTLNGQTEKVVMKEWSNFMKVYSGKTKRDRKSGEMVTEKLSLAGMGSNTVIYAQAQQFGEDVIQTAWFELDGIMLGAKDKASSVATEIMESFIIHMKRLKVDEELDFQTKNLADLEKSMSQATKLEEKSTDQIAKYELALQEAKADLESSKRMQQQHLEEIEYQHEILDRVKSLSLSVDLDTEVSDFIKTLDAERAARMQEIQQAHAPPATAPASTTTPETESGSDANPPVENQEEGEKEDN